MRNLPFWSGLASVLSLTLALPAYAQTPAGDTGGGGDIIVTARRTEEKLQDVPISITVYNQQSIANRNIINTADLATYTPSLSLNNRFGGPEKASFAIRGFQQDIGTVPSVGVYFADVVGPRGASSTPGGNGVGVGNLFDLQNVQVLKGPQGTLFGRNTTGGAVLLVPQRPTDKLEGYVEGSAGNYDMWRLQGVLNVPLSDTFKLRLGVDRMKRGGFLINHSGIGPDRLANTNYIAGRLSILAQLTPDLENYIIGTYTRSDNHGYVPRIVGCNPSPSPTDASYFLELYGANYGCAQLARENARGWWDVENSDPYAREMNETWQVINTTTWQVSDTLKIKNILSYGEQKEITNISLEGGNWTNPDVSQFLSVLSVDQTPGIPYADESTMTEELQFQGKGLGGRLNWQAGGYLEIDNPLGYGGQTVPFFLNCTDEAAYRCQAGQTIFGSPLSNMTQSWWKYWWRSKGLYAQGTYSLTDKLSLTAGVRYTWDTMTHYQAATVLYFPADNTPIAFCANPIRNPGPGGTGTFKPITPGDFHQCDLQFTARSQKPTWTMDLEYKVVPDVMLFAKYSRGYRAGGVNTPFVLYETWGPEKVDTYEIGAKTSFRGAVSGYLNVTGFYNDFRNQQIQATLEQKVNAPTAGGTAILNAGKSRIWGIEVDGAVTLFDSLKVEVGYAYLNTKLLELVGIPPDDNSLWVPGQSPWASVVPSAKVGGPLALSPKNRITLTGTYTLPLDASVGKISIGATFVHTDSQIGSQATASEFGILPATNVLNLNANWNDVMGQPFDLAFFMTNATDAAFPTNVVSAYNVFGFESQIPNEPRMWGFRLRYRFGS